MRVGVEKIDVLDFKFFKFLSLKFKTTFTLFLTKRQNRKIANLQIFSQAYLPFYLLLFLHFALLSFRFFIIKYSNFIIRHFTILLKKNHATQYNLS